MALLSAQNLRIAFGGRPLLDDATLQIERGDRIGLVGRNGEGKSTLLKIVSGEIRPDEGRVIRDSGMRIGVLSQVVPDDLGGSAASIVAQGLDPIHPLHGPAEEDHRVARVCSRLEVDPRQPFGEMSGGQKRRTLLARALVEEPDLLLLDEPTNHLDIAAIEWIESFLARFDGSLLFVTHDRAFLQSVATRIVELDRGRLTSWECDWETFQARKEALLADEEKQWAEFDRKLAEEEAWIRRGIKARRTRNEGRVRALEAMRKERADRRTRTGSAAVSIQEAGSTGKRVIRAKDVSFRWEGEPIVRDFSTEILRGDKVGVIGPNGAGKTTLLNLLLGELEPDEGSVTHGTALRIGYFDQHREQLDDDRSVRDVISHGSDFVQVGDDRKHVMGYLQDFLFSPERARQPVRSLSGGERNRLLLARLFTKPANVLVLDEPTNDLDTDTLELLEARLVEFSGTVLVVSHDRAFLDNLCTSTLVFEGDGRVKEYVGGWSDWQRVVSRREAESAPATPRSASAAPKSGRQARRAAGADDGPRKLSWKEQQELKELPGRIEALETEVAELHARMGDPEFYRGDPDEIREVRERAEEAQAEIDAVFERWSALAERETVS